MTLTIVVAMVAIGVPSGPPAQALTIGQIEARIKVLKASLSHVAFQLNEADDHLTYLRQQIAQHYTALRTANAKRAQLATSVSARAAQLYILGGQSSADSMTYDGLTEYVQRMTYLEQIGFNQQRLIEELHALQANAKMESQALAAQEKDAAQTVKVFSARRATLASQLSELTRLQSFLDSVAPRNAARGSRGGIHGMVCPVVGPHVVVNNFGAPRPGGPHQGDDIDANTGQYVRAVLPATVVDTPTGSWWGIGIKIRDLTGTEWWYAHLSARWVHIGEHVDGGELMGRVGCTGNCTGPHLHFEWHPGGGAARDPYRILSAVC
ncbi:MAG: murein hydrolase activator EnvC family protein [Actinomycetota bacterium]